MEELYQVGYNVSMDWNELAGQCDDALSEKDVAKAESLISQIEALETTAPENKQVVVNYLLGNLHSGLSLLLNENTEGWKNDSYPFHFSKAINRFRTAEKFSTPKLPYFHEIKANLANELCRQARILEVLERWNPNFLIPGDSPFISAYSKSQELLRIGHFLNDPSHQQLYQYEAYKLLKAIKTYESDIPPQLQESYSTNPVVKALLEFGDKNFSPLSGWDDAFKDKSKTAGERRYRAWCCENRLFLNFINDITIKPIANRDILQFPNYVTDIQEGPYLSAAFSAIKREYCFARFLAFEGIHGIHPSYEDKGLFLTNTLDYVHYDGGTEKIKAAMRICFGTLDSLALLMNQYFNEKATYAKFTTQWIKENLKTQENVFISALYWLACDLTDTSKIPQDKWKAPNPNAAELKIIRNSMEHGWLRVAEQKHSVWVGKSDFAYTISPQDFEKRCYDLLKLVRSAMMYVYLAVSVSENNRPSDKPAFPASVLLMQDDLIALTKDSKSKFWG